MRIIIGLLVAFNLTTAFAQLKPIIQDDFSSNKYGWEESATCSFSNGEYNINSAEDGDHAFLNFFIDPTKDFVVSVDLNQKSGLEDNGYGIVWGSSEENYNLFVISSQGDYAIYHGDPALLKNWRHHKAIQPKGKINQLTVEFKMGKLVFSINGEKVEEHKPYPFFGNSVGIINFTQMLLSADNLVVAQDQSIELPDEISKVKKENLGTTINGEYDDLGPIISTDGKILYLAKQNVIGNVGGVEDDEDVWMSRWENSQWTKAINMGKTVNTKHTDNLLAVSADNNTLMFEEENQLAVKHRTETGWTLSEKLNLTFKNELDHFVACLSSDGKAVLFSAKLKSNIYYDPKRNEGDLYICLKTESNSWSAPINLGATINSMGEDTSPYLSADGKTLYFASDGRPGFGNQDIFVSTRIGESWTEWTKPINLGPEVNSVYFDAYYTLPASGDYAYFVSYDKGYGLADIFRIKLHASHRPSPVTLVKGKVLSTKNGQPLAASIHFENLRTRKDMGEARSDPKTGAYQIILPFGVNYGVRARRSDFYSVHENLELPIATEYNEVQKDLMMVPIEIGETIKLNNVFFEAGLATLKSESYPELDRLVTILKENPTIAIELAGHTDNRGTGDVLIKLSEDRVATVKEYLIKDGIDKSRIDGHGYGASRPIAKGDSEEDRKLNRRVEFKITKK